MRGKSQRGQSLVEGTLVMLVFFALLLGVVDFGQVMFAHEVLVERVRGAVRWGTLHPEAGADAVRNMVLYSAATASGAPYLGMKPENIVVEYRDQTSDAPVLHVEIVNFEAPMYAPWWPEGTHKLISRRPVSVSAPLVEAHRDVTAAGAL